MGAVAITNRVYMGQMSQARGRIVKATLTGSASYATGGDTLSLASLGMTRVEAIAVLSGTMKFKGVAPIANAGGASIRLAGTPTVPLITFFAAALGAETQVPNATNLSTVTATVLFFGRG